MEEKRYRVRLGDSDQHWGVPLTKAEAEESVAWARRFGIHAEIIEEPGSASNAENQ
jgi:hypothetical protein